MHHGMASSKLEFGSEQHEMSRSSLLIDLHFTICLKFMYVIIRHVEWHGTNELFKPNRKYTCFYFHDVSDCSSRKNGALEVHHEKDNGIRSAQVKSPPLLQGAISVRLKQALLRFLSLLCVLMEVFKNILVAFYSLSQIYSFTYCRILASKI